MIYVSWNTRQAENVFIGQYETFSSHDGNNVPILSCRTTEKSDTLFIIRIYCTNVT